MRIFYSKKTGQIVGTVDGFSQGPDLDKTMIIPKGTKKEDIGMHNIKLGDKEEKLAREFEDPKNSKKAFDYKIALGEKNKVLKVEKK